MRQPCNNCPFRKEVRFPLKPARIKKITEGLLNDETFSCHKTTGRKRSDWQICFGSVLFLENIVQSGCRSNFRYRLEIRLGRLDITDLRQDDAIWNSVEEMIQGCQSY